MHLLHHAPALRLLLIVVSGMPSCCCPMLPTGPIQVNTVTFTPTDPLSGISDPAPGVWIDTHVDLDFSTSKPNQFCLYVPKMDILIAS